MSWLRSSPLRQSLTTRNGTAGTSSSSSTFFTLTTGGGSGGTNSHASGLRQRPIDTATDCDPRACYDSFCKHWQQAYDIIQRADPPQRPPTHDDVLAVVSHLDFMVTLLLVELHHCNRVALPSAADAAPPAAPCLEFLLSENLLDKLYEWGCTTGRYANAVRLEQLKLYELLVSHSRHQLLCHEPFLRPLLKILASSQGEIFPPDLEKRLVILLNQLCVVLMQNVHLLDLFFFSSQAQEQQQRSNGSTTNFIIFSLLIPYVHREGSLGHQARDALLLCMALSQKNSNIGTYIAQYSSMCPLLVTGLGGLYSRLPNSIEITAIDWHRITPDDVTEIPELTLFMNALEFCNAVVQVAHEMIKQQLLDFMYQGFIVPVLGPAILQTLKGKHFQTNVESQISTMSYLDLILRSVTEPGLLRAFVQFLLDTEKFDGERILDTLVERLTSTDPNLCMVTMALFDTLLGLNCEDLMLELVLKYMLPGKHVPISHRHKINRIDPYTNTAQFLLDLTPDVMKRARELTKHKSLGDTVQKAQSQPALPSPTSTMSKTIGANWNYYGMHGGGGDSLYANIHAYLFEAHQRVAQCQAACAQWANTYRYQRWPPRASLRANALEMVRQFFSEFSASPLSATSGVSGSSSPGVADDGAGDKGKQFDSLQSIGESSGYESFKWRPADEEVETGEPPSAHPSAHNADAGDAFDASGQSREVKREIWRVSHNRNELLLTDLDFSEDLFAQGTVSLGPFLNAIWGKLQTFTSNTLYVNLHLTGLITHLAWYPLPLLHSILLRPDIVITSDTPSFHQVLRILKQQIDAELPVIEDSLEIVDVARSHLIDREFRLLNVRKANESSPHHTASGKATMGAGVSSATTGPGAATQSRLGQPTTTFANISAASPVQLTPSSSYDPFRRSDAKRKSISKSITSMFSRKPNGTSGTAFNGSSSSASNSGMSPSQQTAPPTNAERSTMRTRETSLTTLPAPAVNERTHSAGNAASTLENNNAPATTSAVGATTTHNGGGQTTTTTTANNTPTSASIASALVGGSVGSTSTLNTTLSTLNGGGGGGGGGGNSEPVSLESLSSMGAIANTSGTERTRDLALCAVLLDEWLKELAAIAQEHSVVLLNELAI